MTPCFNASSPPAHLLRHLMLTAAVMAAVVAFSSRVALGQGSDSIEPVQGRDIRCVIKSTTPQGIQYEVSGQSQQISLLDIKSVKFAGEPNEIARARTRIQSGQFDDGITELQKVAVANLKDLPKAEWAFLQALAESKKSLVDGTLAINDAATTVKKFLETYPNSFHFFDMTETFGQLAFHSGQFAAADKSFQTLTESTIPPVMAAGYLGLAKSALEQSKWDDAQKQLVAIAAINATDDKTQEIKLIAKCLEARILAEQNQVPKAVAQLEEIIKSESDDRTRVFANLYNALGLAHLRGGEPKKALLAFLHTDQLYANEADPHAESLYYLSMLWGQINETDRSNRAKQTLSQQYRNSLWASKK